MPIISLSNWSMLGYLKQAYALDIKTYLILAMTMPMISLSNWFRLLLLNQAYLDIKNYLIIAMTMPTTIA